MTKIGVIGAGKNGSGHARYFAECPRSRVVAVADPDARAGSELAEEVNAELFDDFHEILPLVDAVVISSPNQFHRDQAVECARAGRHVWVEKPMGLNAEEARDIADAVEEAGVESFVGFSVRFGALVQTMIRWVEGGELGELVSIWSRRMTFREIGDHESWRADPALSGGLLFEINIHELEWMMALGGDVASVYARKYARRDTGPRANDHIWFTLKFAEGAVGTHEGSWVSPVPDYSRGMLCEEGGLASTDWGRELVLYRRGEGGSPAEMEERFDKRAHFLDCIEKGVASRSDAAWGLKVMTVADALLESAATGEVVAL